MRAVLILLLCAAAGIAAPALAQMPSDGLMPGELAPDIAGPMLVGEPLRLSDLRGRVVVVDFWASYCGPCIIAMPEFERLRTELHAMGYADRFEVLGVTVDQDVDKAIAFIERTGVSYPVISDLMSVASRRYGVWRLPATYLLDGEGRAFRIYHGYGDTFGTEIRRNSLLLLQRMALAEEQGASTPRPLPDPVQRASP